MRIVAYQQSRVGIPWSWLATAMVCASLVGCGSGEARVPVVPAKGTVQVNGEVPAGAYLVFHPVGETPKAKDPNSNDVIRPSGQVAADGSFQLTTYDPNDGAPEGDYAVTVQWFKLVKEGRDATAGPNVVPVPYSTPETTPLKLKVAAGGELPAIQIKGR